MALAIYKDRPITERGSQFHFPFLVFNNGIDIRNNVMRKKEFVIGKRFGSLVITKELEEKVFPSGVKHRQVECLCDCGKSKKILLCNLNADKTKSCGCYLHSNDFKTMRSDMMKGKKLSKESIEKRTISRLENVKIDKLYCDIFYSQEYKADCRKEYCERCGISKHMNFKLYGRAMDLHHYKSNFDCAPNDLQTLCKFCHLSVSNKGKSVSKEARKKMSEAAKRRGQNNIRRNL